MSDYIAHEEEKNGLTLKIVPDQDPSNPRHEWDNAAVFICWHRRYELGDTPKRIVEDLPFSAPSPEDFREWMRTKEGKAAVIVPLYLYDHSGITIKAGSGFSCAWDSGQIGFAVITAARGRKEWGRQWRKQARACIMSETETYDSYLTGDVYGYTVTNEDGETLDSCGGFFGLECAKEEGAAALKCQIRAQEETLGEEHIAGMNEEKARAHKSLMAVL